MTANEIPEATSRYDAFCVESDFGGRDLDWKLTKMAPEELRERCWAKGFARTNQQCIEFSNHSSYPKLVESIRRFGIQEPLVICDCSLEGNHRLAAAIALEFKEVPVYLADPWTPMDVEVEIALEDHVSLFEVNA